MEPFKRSYLTLVILNILQGEEEAYGYRIAQVIKERSEGQYDLKEGSLYPLLHTLEKGGFIQGEWRPSPQHGPERKYLCLTPKGRRLMEKEKQALSVLVRLALGTGQDGA
jgi:PadR family transcriptional regulator PadR